MGPYTEYLARDPRK